MVEIILDRRTQNFRARFPHAGRACDVALRTNCPIEADGLRIQAEAFLEAAQLGGADPAELLRKAAYRRWRDRQKGNRPESRPRRSASDAAGPSSEFWDEPLDMPQPGETVVVIDGISRTTAVVLRASCAASTAIVEGEFGPRELPIYNGHNGTGWHRPTWLAGDAQRPDTPRRGDRVLLSILTSVAAGIGLTRALGTVLTVFPDDTLLIGLDRQASGDCPERWRAKGQGSHANQWQWPESAEGHRRPRALIGSSDDAGEKSRRAMRSELLSAMARRRAVREIIRAL